MLAGGPESEKYQAELLRIQNPNIYVGELIETAENHSIIHLVNQGRWAAGHLKELRWLAAFGANPCFLVSIFDYSSGRGALAHLDSLTDPAITISTMQQSLSYPTPETDPNYEVTLVGGSNSPLDEMAEILREVREMQANRKLRIDIQVGNIRQDSASFALDLKDGLVYSFSPHRSLTSYQPIGREKMQMRLLQGKRVASADPILGF